MKLDYSLYCIIDDSICRPDAMINMASRLVDCGINCMQLRMKSSAPEIIAETSKKILEIAKSRSIPIIINDYVEIAKNINADGVHIGQGDIPYFEARQYLGHEKIIGLSIENKEQAQACCNLEVDYFGVGPVYRTRTKSDAASPIGVQQLKEMRDLLPKPIVAIGGIDEGNIFPVLKTGVAGVAIASAILTSPYPAWTARKLAWLISDYRQNHAQN